IASGQGTKTASIYVGSSFTSGNVCVTADNTCMSSKPRCVAIKKTPSVPSTLTGPTTVCAGQQNVSYSTNTVFGATNYQWIVPSGSVITSGQGTPNITVDFGTKTGSVGVNAYNACGQAGRRAVLVSFNCRLGEMSSSTSVIEISPNPTSTGMVNLTVNSEVNGIALIKMTDILGKSVLIKNIANVIGTNNHKLDLSKFNKGIYLLTVDTGSKKQTLKVVIQ
ncbi:MAG: T9SS type A sorting domain-containing protein, partial [Bacteroidota bacterium]